MAPRPYRQIITSTADAVRGPQPWRMRSPYERTGAERVVFEFAFAIVIMITLSEQKESAPTTAESPAASAMPADMNAYGYARMPAPSIAFTSVKTPTQ